MLGVLVENRLAVPVVYLPQKRIDDSKRCQKAGVPKTERVFRTKEQLAFEIVVPARHNKLRFGWVGAEFGFG